MASGDLEVAFILNDHADQFESFIRNLRSQVVDPTRPPPVTNRSEPRLLPPTIRGRPQRWLLLRLRVAETDNNEIILWMRPDNLYVVGFGRVQRGGMTGPRFEFGSTEKQEKAKGKNQKAKKKNAKEEEGQSQQLIPSSQLLGFGGNYDSLGGLSESTLVGWYELIGAIDGLRAYPEQRRQSSHAIGPWLRTIIITFSESTRLHTVCEHVRKLLQKRRDARLEGMCRQITCWGQMCAAVIASAKEGNDGDRYKYLQDQGVCSRTPEACDIVAILNHGSAKKKEKRQKREASGRVVDDVPDGLTFVEIFSVDIGCRSRTLYGEINIDDGISMQELFKKPRSDPLHVGPGELAYLTGPSRAVWGYGEVVMHVDLMDAVGYVLDMTTDDEVGSGQLVLNTYDTPAVEYDKVLDYVFEGLSGAVNVRCALITNAVVANVVVVLNSNYKEDVYGTLSAGTDMFGPTDKITLFNRERKDAVSVQDGERIPLLRSVAVVPLNSCLIIDGDLFARTMSPDDGIVNHHDVVFHPGFDMSEEKVILVGAFTVRLRVTWSRN